LLGNKQKGMLSVSLCFIIQAQHFLWLGQVVLGQAHFFVVLLFIWILLTAHFVTAAIIRTAAGWFFSCNQAKDYRRRATNPCIDFNRLNRAIHGTSTAFHTGIFVCDVCCLFFNPKYTVRANFRTAFAPDTFIGCIFKCSYVF
jgi:hypothetical protein